MTLEQTLAEVGPIFNKGSFAHASMQDVTTARHLADEIAAKRVDIRDAYNYCWSTKTFKSRVDWLRTIAPQWRPVLSHLHSMLSPEDVKIFVETVSNSFIRLQKEKYWGGHGIYELLLMDLEPCAPHIGTVLSDREGIGKEIIEALGNDILRLNYKDSIFYWKYFFLSREGSEDHNSEYEFNRDFSTTSKEICYILSSTSSNFAFETLIDYLCPSDAERHSFIGLTWADHADPERLDETLYQNMKKFAQRISIADEVLIRHLCHNAELNDFVWHLIAEFGGASAFERMVSFPTNSSFYIRSNQDHAALMYPILVQNYFKSVFRFIKRNDFNPVFITQFNAVISSLRDNLREEYNIFLRELSQDFQKETGQRLYDILEKKGVQFFDAEKVYK